MLTIDDRTGFSDCEAAGSFPGNSAGSSSNSSLSTRSLDSPSTSLEQVHPANAGANTSTSWDSDVDVEADPPEWSQGVSEEVLARLSNSEKKRQEVINGSFNKSSAFLPKIKIHISSCGIIKNSFNLIKLAINLFEIFRYLKSD